MESSTSSSPSTRGYYLPSGRFSSPGLFLLLVCGIVAAAMLAVVYAIASWYIPWIYVNAVLTVFAGGALGFLVLKATRLAKLRSPSLAKLIGLVCGLLLVYVQWAVYVSFLFSAGETTKVGTGSRRATFTETTIDVDNMIAIATNPSVIGDIMGLLFTEGSWSIFGMTFSGGPLGVVWLLELALIVGAAVMLSPGQTTAPFSETDNDWMVASVLPGALSPAANATTLAQALKSDRVDALLDAELNTEPGTDRITLTVFSDRAGQEAFLSLTRHEHNVDDQGKASEDETVVVEAISISAENLALLRERFG